MSKKHFNQKGIVGNKYGRLLVVEESSERGNKKQIKYRCKCECGKEHIVTGECLRSGKSKSCGCLRKEWHNKNAFKRTTDREEVLLKIQYGHIKKRNKKYGDEIISFIDFSGIVKKECMYCGISYSKKIEDRACETKAKGKITDFVLKINGIDRVDNTKGYVRDNCVSCCSTCNSAKGTKTLAEFIGWIKNLNRHFIGIEKDENYFNIAKTRIENHHLTL